MSERPKKQPRLGEAATSVSGSTQNAATNSAPWVERKTMVFPKGLPMEYTYHERKFYVRDCYPTYYNIVLSLLSHRETEVVTVTGTPGIGKSVFYAYFLKRFSHEDMNATIIAVSFSRDSVMMKVAVWKGGKLIDSEASSFMAMDALICKTEKNTKGGLIYLHDGPPKFNPVDVKAVCFTSPYESWLRYIRKTPAERPKVIMPLWSLEELEMAAVELGLAMKPEVDIKRVRVVTAADHCRAWRDTERDKSLSLQQEEESVCGVPLVKTEDASKVVSQVAQRFQVFGGVARSCLSTRASSVDKFQREVESTIRKLRDPAKLRAILKREEDPEENYHDVCLFEPKENPSEHTIAEPTPFVKRLVLARVSEVTRSNGDAILDCLRLYPSTRSFCGALFENSVFK